MADRMIDTNATPRSTWLTHVDRWTDRAILALGRLAALALRRVSVEIAKGRPPVKLPTGEMGFTVSGKAGETKVIQVRPEEWFKPERLIVVESHDMELLNGTNTILTQAYVGAQNIFPTAPGEGSGISSACFAHNSLGNFIAWSPCHLGQSITLHVYFLRDCTWNGTLFGSFDRDGTKRR